MRHYVQMLFANAGRLAGMLGLAPYRRRRVTPAMVLCLAAVVSGCGAQAGQQRQFSNDPVPVDYESATFPLDAFRFSEDQATTINLARAVLIQACLSQFGVDHPIPPDGHGPPFKTIDDRYGLVEGEHAAQWGYRGKPAPGIVMPYEFTVPSQAHHLVFGDTRRPDGTILKGGCLGEARERLNAAGGIVDIDTGLVNRLDRDAWDKSRLDPRVQARIVQWRDCVGQDYADPQDAVREWNSHGGAHGLPTPDEVTAALKDVDCKESVRLTGIWAAVDIEYQRRAVDENRSQLQALRQWQMKQLEEANRLAQGR